MPEKKNENPKRYPVVTGEIALGQRMDDSGEPLAVTSARAVIDPDEQRLSPVPRRKRRPWQPPPPAPRRTCLGTCALFGGLSVLVLTLVFAFLMLVMIIGVADFLGDPLDNFLGVFGFEDDATPQVVDSRTIVLGIKEMALLQTVSGDIQVTKTVVDTGPAPDAELRVSFVGHVTAGIDLSLIGDEDVQVNPDGSLTIILPPAQLTGCYLGKPEILTRNCTDIPFVQDCAQIVQRMQAEAYDRAIDELRETAYEQDLTGLAYGEAEARIFDLLNRLGHTRIVFQRSAEGSAVAETCFP
jgi:hypothetical protein